ncbi:zinc finger FYVE domain-containing protein 16-like [Branchiostoma lanceolatum]|uniref:zinc finger FYVE domain-containing protein 16-like n=1 Tax=Branchiostoma lanceolatum TaxID=7740 RepID=UPI0034532D1F
MEQSFFAAANDLDNVLDEFERNEDFQLGQSVDFPTAKPTPPAQAPQTNAPGNRAPDSSLAGFYPVITGDGARASPQYHPAAVLQHPTGGAVYNGGNYSGGDGGMASFGAQSQVKGYPGHSNVNGPTGQLLGTSTASNYQSQAGLVNYQTTGAGTFHGYQGQPGMNTHQAQVAVNNLQEQQALSSYQTVAGQNSYSEQGGVNSFPTQPPMGSYQPHVGNSSFQAQTGLNSYPAAGGLIPHPLPGVSQHPTVRQPDFQLPGPMLDSQVQSSVPSLNTQPSMSLHGGAYPSVGRSSSPPKPVNLATPEAQVPNSTAMVKPDLYPMSAGLTQGVSSTGTGTIVGVGQGMYPSVPASTGLYPAADLTQPTIESNVVGLKGDGLYPQTATLTQMANIATEGKVGITSSVKGGGLYPQTTGLQTTLGTGGVASISPGIVGGEGTMYPSIGLAKPVTTNIQAQATADELVKYMMTSQILKKDRDTQPALSSGNPNVSFESAPITVNTMGEGGLQSAASLEVNLGGKPAPKAQISSLSNSRSGKTDLEDIVQDTGERRNVIAPTTGMNILGATEKENKGEGQKQGLENNMTANIVTKEDIGRKVENSQLTVTAINSSISIPNVEQTVVLSDNKATIPPEQVAYRSQGIEESVVLEDDKSSEPIHSNDTSVGDGNTGMTQNSKMTSAALKGNGNVLGGATATGNISVQKNEVEQTATEDLKMAENVDGVEQAKGGAQMIGFTPEAEVEEEFDDAEIDAYLGTEGVGLGNSGNESMVEAGREDARVPKSDAVLEQVMEKSSQEGSVTSVSQLPVTLFLPTSGGERKEQKSDQVLNNNEGKTSPEGGVTVVGELSDADPFFSAQASTSPTDTITSMEEEEERCRMSQTAAATSPVNSILDDRTIEQKAGNSETYVKEGLEERFQIESRKLSDIIANDGNLDEGIADTMATGRLDHGDGLRTVEDFSASGLVGKNIEAAAWSEEKAGSTVNRATETERMLGLPVDIKATVHQQGGEGEGGGNPEGQGISASLDGAQSLSSAGAHYGEDGTNPSLQGTATLGDNPSHSQQPPGHTQQPPSYTQQPPGHTQQPNQTESAVDGDRSMQTAVANMAISGQMEHDQQQQPITDYCEPWDTRQAPHQDMPQDGVRMPPHPPLGVASPEDVGFPPNVEMFRDDLSSVLPSDIGWEAPVWVPDEDAPNCMKCEAKFTFTKRRHHCRACGKVLCSACCSQKARLAYMDNKSARVCSTCYNILQRAQARGQIAGISQVTPSSGQASPNPNNPMEYCSTLPPMQQAQEALQRPPPSVLVPVGGRPQGALGVAQREGRHVRFSDGSIPGGDGTSDSSTPSTPSHPITTPQGAAAVRPRAAPNTSPQHKGSPSKTTETRARLSPSKNRGQHSERQSGSPRHGGSPRKTGSQRSPPRSRQSSRTKSLIPEEEDRLPPVILSIGDKGDYEVDSEPDPDRTLAEIKREETDPVMFLANPNLVVLVKVINLSCCVNRLCWCFSTRGMHTVSQDEVVILLEAMPDDDVIPRDIFAHLQMVYEEAGKGNTVGDLGHTIFNQPFLGSREHGGFLYIQPTFQCTQRLILPDPPYVVGVLLQKWETPWAKVFPIRLMLRLGAEFRYYPCPLFSVRFRKPVYCEIGHTIMNLLADFRNFQYMLGQVRGVVILLEDKRTLVRIPSNRYDDMMKVLNNCNEHVLSWGSNFSEEADSHLVCIQNDEGAYQTQAISIQNRQRKVTGASFIVFNGSLKTTAGLRGKSSIVEDGVMVQILPETMSELRQALRNMKDYTIGCGSTAAEEPDETVEVRWVEDDRKMNIGVTSPIDGQSMEGLTNIHVHSGMDFAGEHRTIRWTEVFFLQTEDSMPQCEPMELSRLAESIATATCVALVQHLDSLREAGMNKLGLRVNIDRDEVGYVAGSKSQFLPPLYMTDLDNELIPVIHNAAASNQDTPIRLELIFHILHNVD